MPVVTLERINEDNYYDVCRLKVTAEQEAFVQPAAYILARTYAMLEQNAAACAIVNEGNIVGVIMTKELTSEPACYTIEEFLVDAEHQNQGIGSAALGIVLNMFKAERKYDLVELFVKKADTQAIRVYRNAGFMDCEYQDPDAPDSLIMSYRM